MIYLYSTLHKNLYICLGSFIYSLFLFGYDKIYSMSSMRSFSILRVCQPGSKNLLLHSGLSIVIPATCLMMSSSQRFCCLPLFLFPFHGYYYVTILLYLFLSRIPHCSSHFESDVLIIYCHYKCKSMHVTITPLSISDESKL